MEKRETVEAPATVKAGPKAAVIIAAPAAATKIKPTATRILPSHTGICALPRRHRPPDQGREMPTTTTVDRSARRPPSQYSPTLTPREGCHRIKPTPKQNPPWRSGMAEVDRGVDDRPVASRGGDDH